MKISIIKNTLSHTIGKPLGMLTLLAMSGNTWADATQEFNDLLNSHWQEAQKEKIFFRTDPDAWKPKGKLADFSPQGFERREAFNQQTNKSVTAYSNMSVKPKPKAMSFKIVISL